MPEIKGTKITDAGEGVGKGELSCAVSGTVNRDNHVGNQPRDFSKN